MTDDLFNPDPRKRRVTWPRPLTIKTDDLVTLGQARATHRLILEFMKGLICPVCDRPDQIYGRALNSAMARFLIWLYHKDRETPMAWHRVLGNAPYKDHAGEYSKVIMWKLAEQLEGSKKDGNPHRGEYRITNLGNRFVRRVERVTRKLWFYHGDLLDVFDPDDRMIYIDEALGMGFDYDKLMEGKA